MIVQRALGLFGIGEEIILHADHPNPLILIASGCLLAGAQATESLILSALDKLMGEHAMKPVDKPVIERQDGKSS